MDDRTPTQPSDPSVDESYARPSRPTPVRRRAVAGARAGDQPRAPRSTAPTRPVGAGAQLSAPPGWYRRRLTRRLGGVAACLGMAIAVSYCALATVPGQVLDTIFMESLMRSVGRYDTFSSLITGLVSVPVMVVVGVAVACVALARRRPTLAGRALGAFVGANLTTQILKDYILDRPNLGVTTAAGNSLPSGHTTVAVTISLALIVVAPQWLRGPSAWLGWMWTSVMGVSVMMEGWHRPADVVVAVLVAGAWALALSPIEYRERHGQKASRMMVWVCGGLLLVGVLATVVGMWGFSLSAASPGSGYGFEAFLQIRPWRSLVLGTAAVAWVGAACGFVVHEVDRLAGQ